MARCTVCVHPELHNIDASLVSGSTDLAVAKRHGLGDDSVRRHRLRHLTPALVRLSIERRREESTSNALDRLEALYLRAEGLVQVAEDKGALMGGAAVLREARSLLETIARITGELTDKQPVTVVNVLASLEWHKARDAISRALQPFPDARVAVAEALSVLEPRELTS